jgi:Ras-related protein Rab-5C
MYYRNAHAAVVVFDVTNPQSYERAQKWVAELLEKANSGIVIALCGNKVDLDENRKVNSDEVKKYADQIGSFYIEVSAKINLNIDKLFEDIANKLPKNVVKKGEKLEDEKTIEKPAQYCAQC